MGDTLSLPAVISAIEDSDLSFKTLPGVIAYVESRILSFGEGATPAAIEAILSELEGPNTLSRALLRSIVLLKSSELSKQQQSPYGNEGQVFSRTAESVTGEKMRERLLSPTEQAMKEAETKAETSSKLQAEKQMTHETMERLVFPSVEKAYCEEMKSYPTEEPRHAEEPCPAEESWSFCEEVARLDMKEIEALHAKKKRRNGRLIKKDRERLALLIDRVQTRSLTQAELAGAEAAEVASHGKNTTAPAPLPALDGKLSCPHPLFESTSLTELYPQERPSLDMPQSSTVEEEYGEAALSDGPGSRSSETWSFARTPDSDSSRAYSELKGSKVDAGEKEEDFWDALLKRRTTRIGSHG